MSYTYLRLKQSVDNFQDLQNDLNSLFAAYKNSYATEPTWQHLDFNDDGIPDGSVEVNPFFKYEFYQYFTLQSIFQPTEDYNLSNVIEDKPIVDLNGDIQLLLNAIIQNDISALPPVFDAANAVNSAGDHLVYPTSETWTSLNTGIDETNTFFDVSLGDYSFNINGAMWSPSEQNKKISDNSIIWFSNLKTGASGSEIPDAGIIDPWATYATLPQEVANINNYYYTKSSGNTVAPSYGNIYIGTKDGDEVVLVKYIPASLTQIDDNSRIGPSLINESGNFVSNAKDPQTGWDQNNDNQITPDEQDYVEWNAQILHFPSNGNPPILYLDKWKDIYYRWQKPIILHKFKKYRITFNDIEIHVYDTERMPSTVGSAINGSGKAEGFELELFYRERSYANVGGDKWRNGYGAPFNHQKLKIDNNYHDTFMDSTHPDNSAINTKKLIVTDWSIDIGNRYTTTIDWNAQTWQFPSGRQKLTTSFGYLGVKIKDKWNGGSYSGDGAVDESSGSNSMRLNRYKISVSPFTVKSFARIYD